MNRNQLVEQIRKKGSYLCVGLDTDIEKIPPHFSKSNDPIFSFNREIIDATRDLCVSYKINTAFYEAQGLEGWEAMQKTVDYIGKDHFTIADAKRGDIGNTSTQYAKAFFEKMTFDAITVAPYMGSDSIRPFLDFHGKWTIILGLTSNPGAEDFELEKIQESTDSLEEGVHVTYRKEKFLYEIVMEKSKHWGTPENMMFVVGATQADSFTRIREITPDHFYLVPGVGAQGGSLRDISLKAMNKDVGLLVNASRAIIYASNGKDFAEAAKKVAKEYQEEMKTYLK